MFFSRLCQLKFGGTEGLKAEAEKRETAKRKRKSTKEAKKNQFGEEVAGALKRLKFDSIKSLQQSRAVNYDLIRELTTYAEKGEGKAVSCASDPNCA